MNIDSGVIINSISTLVAIIGLLFSIIYNIKLTNENNRLNKIQFQDRIPFVELIEPSVDNIAPPSTAIPQETYLIKRSDETEDYYYIGLDSSYFIAEEHAVIEYCSNFNFKLKNRSNSIIKEIVIKKVAFQVPRYIEYDTLYTAAKVEGIDDPEPIKGIFFKDDIIKIKVCHCFENDKLLNLYSMETLCISFLLKIVILSGLTFYENIRFEGYSGTRPASISYIHSEKSLNIDYLHENSLCL